MNTFVVGDVHGCCCELKKLIGGMGIKWGEDRLVLLGDYIDRGEEEHEVLALLQGLVNKYGSSKIIPLRGNHEQMMLDALGNLNTSGYGFSEQEITFMRSLPVYFEDDSWFYVHGGINPYKDLASQDNNEMLWIREKFYNYPGQLQKKIAFGHTPTRGIHGKDTPVLWKEKIAMDTGCVFGGKLSGAKIVDGEVIELYSVDKTRLTFEQIVA